MSKPTITTISKGKEPTLEEMQKIVGGYIELVYDNGNTQIICNEEGKLLGLPLNREATNVWWSHLQEDGKGVFSNQGDVLSGNVLILQGEARMS